LTLINAELIRTHDIELSTVTDDRPFIDEMVPRSKYLNPSAWRDDRSNNVVWKLTRALIQFTMLLSATSIVLIIGPLLLRRGPEKTPANIVRLFYFGAIGAGFMMIEIGLVRKLGLVLGHPSYSISIVLAALILSTGLGALASRRLFASGVLTEKRAAALIAAYVVAFIAVYPVVVSEIIALPIVVKAGLTLAILFPLGFLMGQLFPRGLELAGRDDPRLVPWAWAINGTSSTIGSAAAFLLSFPLGFDVILYFGVAIYGVILVLPLGRRTTGPEVAEELVPG
jgi:hypothetical protein